MSTLPRTQPGERDLTANVQVGYVLLAGITIIKGEFMANQDDSWIEVGGGDNNDTWDRTGTIVGQYVKKQVDVGPNKSNLYTLKTDDGELGVWGSAVLDTKFENISVGSMVKIESLGKTKGQRGSEYYDYRVFSKAADLSQAEQDVTDIMGTKLDD
jgi:hypothetical protein